MAADIAPATNPASPTDDADDDLDIATLCPYCNTRPPIYTCPRCFARTCSVACSKKHKLFRQCNGIRDPTAYVKRSKLMTEGGVNRDFAFLTGLEKQISRPVDPGALLKDELEETAPDGENSGDKKGRRRKPVIDRNMQKTRIEEMLRPNGTTVKWAPWEIGRASCRERV